MDVWLSCRACGHGVETVTKDYYERSFGYAGHKGVFRVTPDSATHTLAVSLSHGLIPVADICTDRIARLFDLDCDPQHIAQTLGDLGAARPGLRLPGAMDAYEQGVRAILGQLVSVAMAAKLASRVVALCGEPIQTRRATSAFLRQRYWPRWIRWR